MFSTPSKADTSFSSLTPVRFLDSPKAKPYGDQIQVTKQRLDIITNTLLENFTKWQTAQKRGQSLCNSIESIKTKCLESKVIGDTLFPDELKPFCDKLVIILSVFEDLVKNTKELLRQLNGLAELAKNTDEPLYRTWVMRDFVQFTRNVLERYQREYVVKKFVTEEIAHCQARSDLVRCSSLWEYPAHVDDGVRVMFLYLAEEIKVK